MRSLDQTPEARVLQNAAVLRLRSPLLNIRSYSSLNARDVFAAEQERVMRSPPERASLRGPLVLSIITTGLRLFEYPRVTVLRTPT